MNQFSSPGTTEQGINTGVSLRARHYVNLPVVSMILPTQFDQLDESSKNFCPPVNTSCASAENASETPGNQGCHKF